MIGSLDDLVAQTIDALADTGRLSQTLVVFASDNGYMWGEHRATGKGQPYDAATRIPMVARMDGVIGRHMVDGRLALNVDIASTIEDVTGLSFPGLAGQSLLNPSTRSGFVLEATSGGESTSNRPAYCGWRQRDRVYVRYGDGGAEFYNLATDPFETNNKIVHRQRNHGSGGCVWRREVHVTRCRRGSCGADDRHGRALATASSHRQLPRLEVSCADGHVGVDRKASGLGATNRRTPPNH